MSLGDADQRKPVASHEDILRLFSGGKIDNNVPVNGSLSPVHDGDLSVERPAVYSADVQAALVSIRMVARLKLRQSGRFIQWNVDAIQTITAEDPMAPNLLAFEDPLPAEDGYAANPAHAVVSNVPSETLAADYLLDLLRPMIKAVHPAI